MCSLYGNLYDDDGVEGFSAIKSFLIVLKLNMFLEHVSVGEGCLTIVE